jgi:hypothetical protein
VDAHEHRLRLAGKRREGRVARLAVLVARLDQRDVLRAVDARAVRVRREPAKLGGHARRRPAALDEHLAAARVRDEVGGRRERDAPAHGEATQLRQAHRR